MMIMNEPEKLLKSSSDLREDVQSSYELEAHLNKCAHEFFEQKKQKCDVEAVMFFTFFRLFSTMLATVCIRRENVGEVQELIHDSLVSIRKSVQAHISKYVKNER